jgi:hypothetical protein
VVAIPSRNSWLGLLLATACAAVMQPATGHAYTPEQQQACTNDAFKFCSAEIPDVDRVTVCMIRNKTQLSPGCRVYFKSGPDEAGVTPGKPLSISPAAAHRPVGSR